MKYVTKVLSTTLNASCLSNEIMIDFILEYLLFHVLNQLLFYE